VQVLAALVLSVSAVSRRVAPADTLRAAQRTEAAAEEKRGAGAGDDDAVARSLSEARASGAVVVRVVGWPRRLPLPIKMRAVGAGPAVRCGAARVVPPPTFWGSQIFTATCQVPAAATHTTRAC